MRRAALWLAVAAAAVFALASCEAPTVSDTFVLELEPGAQDQRVGATWRVADLGRLAVDWRVTNIGADEGSFELAAQAQTSGNRLDSACDAIAGRSVRIVATPGTSGVDLEPPSGATVETIRDLDQSFVVATTRESVSWLQLRITDDSRYRIVTSANVGLLVFPTNSDTPLTPISAARGGDTGCSGIQAAQTFDLFSGIYLLRFAATDEGSVRVLVEEDCAAQRVVGRSCPGSFGDTRVTAVGPLAVDASAAGRLGSDVLGVGDQISLELQCLGAEGECHATVAVAIVNEVLECRNDEACRGGRTCSEDGYCLLDDTAGCSAGDPGRGWPMMALAALAWAALRRRRAARAPCLCGLAVVLLLLPGRVEGAGPGGQVYTEVVVSSLAYTGALGRLTSPGVGLELGQGLQFGTLGARLAVGTSYYLTRQQGPPNEHLLQTFHVSAGPRVGHSVSMLRLLGSVDYLAAAFVTNAAAATTGPRTLAHGLGASLAARFEGALPAYVEVRLGGDALFGLRVPAVRFGVTVAFGVGGAI